jgi:hypothetical protein
MSDGNAREGNTAADLATVGDGGPFEGSADGAEGGRV